MTASITTLVANPPIQLAAPDPDDDVVEILEELLEQARTGEIIGIVGVSIERKRDFVAFKSLSIDDMLIHTLGCVRVLQMELEQCVELSE